MDFVVSREDLHRFQWLDGSEPEPGPGDALLKVDRFAFTANNVTYAVFGEAMSGRAGRRRSRLPVSCP